MIALGLAITAAAAAEWCNGVDDDGDGRVDEGPAVVGADRDGDGVAESEALAPACAADALPAGDCADEAAGVFPGAVEVCNATDDDCDGAVDEGACPCPVVTTDTRSWQTCTAAPETWSGAERACRADGSWHLASLGSTVSQREAEQVIAPFAGGTPFWIGYNDRGYEGQFVWSDGSDPTWANWRTGEPNDGGAYAGPEDCTEIEWDGRWDDQTCSDVQPYLCEDGCDASAKWYPDLDEDGLGDRAVTDVEATCAAPDAAGWVTNRLDCDDGDPDQPAAGWLDGDGDGVGAGDAVVGCGLPLADRGGDCDDGDAAVGPGRVELGCNDVDDDCDPATPDVEDADGDGFDTCTDCDDTDRRTFPGAPDDPVDGLDTDCDGAAEVVDSDRDGLPDRDEAPGDADGDGVPDRLDPDSDDDGALDGADPAVHDPGGAPAPTAPAARWGFGCATPPAAPWGLGVLLAALARRRR